MTYKHKESETDGQTERGEIETKREQEKDSSRPLDYLSLNNALTNHYLPSIKLFKKPDSPNNISTTKKTSWTFS